MARYVTAHTLDVTNVQIVQINEPQYDSGVGPHDFDAKRYARPVDGLGGSAISHEKRAREGKSKMADLFRLHGRLVSILAALFLVLGVAGCDEEGGGESEETTEESSSSG